MNLKNISFGLAVLVLTILFIIPINQVLFWDQAVYALHSKYFAGYNIGYSELLFRPILLSLISAPIHFFTTSDIGLKVISLLFSLTLIYSVYKYTRKSKVALLILLTTPLLIIESKNFLTDIPSTLFLFLSVISLQSNNKNSFWISGFWASLMVLTRLGMLYFLPLLLIYSFIKNKKSSLKFIISFSIPYAIYNTWIYFKFNTIIGNIMAAKGQGYRNAEYNLDKFFQITDSIGYTPLLILLIYPIIIRQKNIILFYLIFLITFFIIPFNPENSRFLLPAIPFLVIIISRFVENIKSIPKVILPIMILFSIEQGYNYTTRVLSKIEVKHQVNPMYKYISDNSSADEVIYTNYSYPAVSYYTNRTVRIPLRISVGVDDFENIHQIVMSQKGIVITTHNDYFTKEYIEKYSSHYTFLKRIKDFFLYKYDGNLSSNQKSYELKRIDAIPDVKLEASGLLKLKNKNVEYLSLNIFSENPCLKDLKLNTTDFSVLNSTVLTRDIYDIQVEAVLHSKYSCNSKPISFILRFNNIDSKRFGGDILK